MIRMRTIDAALAQLHAEDPGSALTRHALRQMVLSGRVPSTKVGTKYLLDYDGLLETLSGTASRTPEDVETGKIRRIESR